MSTAQQPSPKRNKGFEETHQDMIETAVRLLSEKGVEALSVSALARAVGINRTTVYYHFSPRDALISAVKKWSSEQLARAFRPVAPQAQRIDYITGFVLENPELMKLWIEDFVSPGDMNDSYPQWDALVKGVAKDFAARGEHVDAEVFCVILLTSAIIGPRVLKNRVRSKDSVEQLKRRFRTELERTLRGDGLLA